MILDSNYIEFLYLRNIEYNAENADRIFVDVWLLAEGMGSDKISLLRRIVKQT